MGPLAIFNADPNSALTGFRQFPNSWAIDWNLFVDLEPRDPENATRTQFAYRIDTAIVDPLGNLPQSIASDPPPSLAQRNLLRGWRLRLPSGQAIARAMGLDPLADDKIIIGQFDTGDPNDTVGSIVDKGGPQFADNCPLWTYVLAETLKVVEPVETTNGPVDKVTRRLGPVGGRIVAETIVGIMATDSSSYISQNPLWKPTLARPDGIFGLRELVSHALRLSTFLVRFVLDAIRPTSFRPRAFSRLRLHERLNVHGYSETSLGAYYNFPARLKSTTSAIDQIALSAFDSLDDTVTVDDLAVALELRFRALERSGWWPPTPR